MEIFAFVILYYAIGLYIMRPVLWESSLENYLLGTLIWPIALIFVAVGLAKRGYFRDKFRRK